MQTEQDYLTREFKSKHLSIRSRVNDLIKAEESLFLFNHSPTGSGKTISWLKPALDDKMKVIAVYPTNALVIDQKKQVDNAISDLDMIHEIIMFRQSRATYWLKKRSYIQMRSVYERASF